MLHQKTGLSPEQRNLKSVKDKEYEVAHLKLTKDFKDGKIPKADFDIAHAKQWDDYVDWSLQNNLMEEVSDVVSLG